MSINIYIWGESSKTQGEAGEVVEQEKRNGTLTNTEQNIMIPDIFN